ncbi:MAG: ThuA domain-containing protein [Phycisphaerales bacterium]
MHRMIVAVMLLGALALSALALTPEPPAATPRVLVFSKTAGFRHASIPDGIAAIRELGKDGGVTLFEVDATEDAASFTDDNLKKYAAVVWLSTTGDVLDAGQQAAFERYIKSGHGYVGVHAASDTEYDWPWYAKLVGAYFKGHPDIQKATIKVEDRNHPSTSMLPERWERTDEWYSFRENPRMQVHVLASLDETTYKPAALAMGDHPVAWYHEYDGGRAWYTALGHTVESYSEPLFRQHLLGGITWAAKLGPAPGSAPATATKP